MSQSTITHANARPVTCECGAPMLDTGTPVVWCDKCGQPTQSFLLPTTPKE